MDLIINIDVPLRSRYTFPDVLMFLCSYIIYGEKKKIHIDKKNKNPSRLN